MAAIAYPTLGGRPPTARRRPAAERAPHLRVVGDPAIEARRLRVAAARRKARRRANALPALACLGLVIGTWFGAGAIASASHRTSYRLIAGATALPSGGERYVVHAGDTLWSIALRLDPSADPRPLVDQLSGELGGRDLQPGMVLTLP